MQINTNINRAERQVHYISFLVEYMFRALCEPLYHVHAVASVRAGRKFGGFE